jgi:uncharacterized protein (TIGR01244 family)
MDTPMLNTVKTTYGFLVSVVRKYMPFETGGSLPEDTYNYLQISESLATSGQPTEAQFRSIQRTGYTTVINLAPRGVLENSLASERELLEELGMEYIHIPVDFGNPTDGDFDRFVSAMRAKADERIWVHCAANMRVSAFVYRYRSTVLGESELVAKNALDEIWEPLGVWKAFVAPGDRS